MNRDEARTRDAEIRPDYHWDGNIYGPMDSTSGGTWIAKNNGGYYAALLNAYGAVSYVPKKPKTRGEIIPLILLQNEPIQHLQQMDLSPYTGFKIIVGQANTLPQLFGWNGQKLETEDFHASIDGRLFFHTSSSVNQDEIVKIRAKKFNEWAQVGEKLTDDKFPNIHLNASPDSSSAILMSRPQSVTKSITSIHMTQYNIRMNYFPVKSNKVSLTN